MFSRVRLAALLAVATTAIVAVSTSAHAQYASYYGGGYSSGPAPYGYARPYRGYNGYPYGGFVSSDVALPSGSYYGSEYGGPFSGPFRTDSAPLTGGGY